MVENPESYCRAGRAVANGAGNGASVGTLLLSGVPEEARYPGKLLIWPDRANSGKDLLEAPSDVGSGSPETGPCSRGYFVEKGRHSIFSLVRRDLIWDAGDNKVRSIKVC